MTGKINDYDDDVDSEKDYKNFILNDVSAYVNDDVEDSDDESLLLCVDVAPNSCGNDGPQGQLLFLRHLLVNGRWCGFVSLTTLYLCLEDIF